MFLIHTPLRCHDLIRVDVCQGLRRTDEQLRASLKALQSEKQNDKRDEVAGSIPRLETDLQAAKDDQVKWRFSDLVYAV